MWMLVFFFLFVQIDLTRLVASLCCCVFFFLLFDGNRCDCLSFSELMDGIEQVLKTQDALRTIEASHLLHKSNKSGKGTYNNRGAEVETHE